MTQLQTLHVTPVDSPDNVQMAYDPLEAACLKLLIALGEDPSREGLLGTPARFARAWREFIDFDPGKIDTSFIPVQTDQLVALTGLRVYSFCEHHLLPFWCDLTIAYITETQVVGLSKLARIAQKHAHRLQIQERLVHSIADEVQAISNSPHVAVIGRGVHLCMVMRGVHTEGTFTTSIMRGAFRDNNTLARQELLHLIG